MKMKKFFSGILAAVMSIAVIATPLFTANADDTTADEKCIITINHAASTGTYTAYPIFVGDVELEEGTNRKLISSPKFHANLNTVLEGIFNGGVSQGYSVVAPMGKEGAYVGKDYSLWKYLKTNDTKVGTKENNVSFLDMIKAYDPNTSLTSFEITANDAVSSQAEALANILNLTSTDNAAVIGGNGILGSTKTSAFYSAFAEAARMLMVDKITSGDVGTLTDTAVGTRAEGSDSVTIQVAEPGYYLVEYTPADYETNSANYESSPKRVRRSLVLVGKGTALSATINSKDTMNIASVDVTFNENILDKATCEGTTPTYAYPAGTTDAKINSGWKKNVSAGNGDYVNCRVVVTLPGNLAAYDQYYLAVPIMYGYNAIQTNDFDKGKSIIRQGSGKGNVKVYLLDDTGNKKEFTTDNFEVMNAESYKYANNSNNNKGDYTVEQDWFVANETFVFADIANIDVKADGAIDTVLAKNSNYNKLVIEFPVKFDRFDKDDALPTGVASNLGFNGTSSTTTNWTGDDALLKNYITARAVYSNNPNLKALKNGEEAYDKTNKPEGVKLYLDTSKDPGALQNPVGVAKESSANIVTYRLRVHATTEDLKELSQAGGVEGIRFVLYDNANKKYAVVTTLKGGTGDLVTYDTVSGEILRDSGGNPGSIANTNLGKIRVYKITGWADSYYNALSEEGGEETLNNNCVLKTFNSNATSGIYANNNTARFEIVGLAPGNYTITVLDETIKTADTYMSTVTSTASKEYTLSKENNKRKTEYRFSFAPTLSETCTKLSYNTHYAPIDADGNWETIGSFGAPQSFNAYFSGHSIITATDKLITNYNMKWYDKDGKEITETEADWWLGQREDVALMSMRVIYIKKGLTLPVTGGIGTFIFFAVGGAMVVLSTVAIVTKLRIKREQL